MAERPAYRCRANASLLLRDARTCELQRYKARGGRDDLERCLSCPGPETLEPAPAKAVLAQTPSLPAAKARTASFQPSPRPAAGATSDPQRVPPPVTSASKPAASAEADGPPTTAPHRLASPTAADGVPRCLVCGHPIPGGPWAVVTVIVSLVPIQGDDSKHHDGQPLAWPVCSANCSGRLAPLCQAVQSAAAELLGGA